ncbi:hypothetical protein L7F22_061417 [Adiantum nelumboides]|nr:hypothetical protein [Adiantum nelumboides]
MLLQRGKESQYMKPIHYASRVKTLHERDYSEIELVMTSMVYADGSAIIYYKSHSVFSPRRGGAKKKVETFAISNASLLYFDGSYRRSHDAVSGGIVVYDAQGNLVRKQGLKLDAKSNNEAEYMALEGGFHICLQMEIKRLQIKGDALLVVKQVLRVWNNKNRKLKNSCFKVKALLKKFESWSLQYIERSQNEEAHEAAQGMITCVFVVKANAPLYHGKEMLSKEVDFLLAGILPEGLLSSKKYALMKNASKYKILDDFLYMKGSDLILRRVPWKEELYKILEENHEEFCGGHFAMKIMLHKILQEGYVWPSIQQDVNHWCKSCLSCQKMGKRILKPE